MILKKISEIRSLLRGRFPAKIPINNRKFVRFWKKQKNSDVMYLKIKITVQGDDDHIFESVSENKNRTFEEGRHVDKL